MIKVTAASQAHFSSSDSAALIFAQESKALHTDLEERSKAEAASEKSYTQKMQRLEVDFVWAVPYFLWGAFKLSITCLTGLCIGRQAQTDRRGTLAKDSLNLCKLFLQQNCYSVVFITCMYEYHRCTSYIDVYRQKLSDVYICVYSIQYTSLFTCDYSQL